MATNEEIENLKASWAADPCWDIEDTEGFQAHRAELRRYRLVMENQWRRERRGQLQQKAIQLGVPGNIKLAAYIESLESKLQRLEGAVSEGYWGAR